MDNCQGKFLKHRQSKLSKLDELLTKNAQNIKGAYAIAGVRVCRFGKSYAYNTGIAIFMFVHNKPRDILEKSDGYRN